MIRAVVNNGTFQPLEPLPASWGNGRELVVEAPEEPSRNRPDRLDEWSKEMNALTATLNDPAEWQTVDALLAEADQQAKAQGLFRFTPFHILDVATWQQRRQRLRELGGPPDE